MGQEFEYQDLSEAVFWAVDLTRAHFRDVDLTGASVTHSRLIDVDIDAEIDRITINGVDVTGFVNEHDPWYPLRAEIRAREPDGIRRAWAALEAAWASAVERARQLGEAQQHESVGGEWSFVQTLRHLVFADDKWFFAPVLGAPAFHPIGISNAGSRDFPWPGIDRDAEASLDEVLAIRAEQAATLSAYLATVTAGELGREVEVLENGTTAVVDCLSTVFEESFQHLRYALRDLDRLTRSRAPARPARRGSSP